MTPCKRQPFGDVTCTRTGSPSLDPRPSSEESWASFWLACPLTGKRAMRPTDGCHPNENVDPYLARS